MLQCTESLIEQQNCEWMWVINLNAVSHYTAERTVYTLFICAKKALVPWMLNQ